METGELLERTVHVLFHVVVDSKYELEPVTTLPLQMEVHPVLVVMKNESPVIKLHALIARERQVGMQTVHVVDFPSHIGVKNTTIAYLQATFNFGAILQKMVFSGETVSLWRVILSMETGEFLERTVHALDHVEVDSRCELEPVTTLPLRMEVHPVLVRTKKKSPVILLPALSMETGDLLERTVHALDHVEVDSKCELEPVTTPPLQMEVHPVLEITKKESPVIQLYAL